MKQKSFRLWQLCNVAFSLALLSMFTISCRKDFVEASPSMIDRTIKVEEVRDWISSQNSGGISSRSAGRTPLNVQPDFKTMTFSPGFGSNTILVAKVDTSSFQTNVGEGALVSFWKDTSGSIRSTLLCWKKTTSSVFDNTYWPLYQQSKFTGIASLVNDDDIIERVGSFQNGHNVGNKKVRIQVVDSSMVDLSNYSGSIASDRDGYGCYNFGGSWWDRLLNVFDGWGSGFDDFWNWLNGSGGSGSGGSGSGDGSGGSGAGTGWGSGGDGWNWTGWGSASSGTGSGSGGTPLWLSDIRKCRTQIFNNMEGNGNQEQLDNPDMCTLYSIFYPDNTLSDEQVQCLYSKSDEIATLTNFLMHHPGDAQAMEIAKFYMNLKCTTSEIVSLGDLNELFIGLNPTSSQKSWLAMRPELIATLIEIKKEAGLQETANFLAFFEEIEADKNLESISHHSKLSMSLINKLNLNPALLAAYYSAVILESAQLRLDNPSWSQKKIAWEAIKNVSMEGLHLSLDVAGLIPGFGEVADLANGVIYSVQGDWTNATFSYAATIPFLGWGSMAAKYGYKTIKFASGRSGKLVFIKNAATNLIEFGNRGQLNKVLGTPSGSQAHHILPWGKSSNEIIQKAAGSKKAFHINEAKNGISISELYHNGSHGNYDLRIEAKLQDLKATFGPNMTPDQAYDGLLEIIQQVRTAIANNPSTHINNLIF